MTFPRRTLGLVFLLLSMLPSAWAATEAGPRIRRATPSEDASQARVIVKYRADSALMAGAAAGATAPRPQHAGRLTQRLGLPLQDGRVLGARTQGLRGSGVSSAELARRLAAMPDVEWAVVDQRATIRAVVPNDPYYAGSQTTITPAVGQWYLRAPDSSAVAAINAVTAWTVTIGLPTVTVAVLDTGVRPLHPDLVGKLYAGYDFISDAATSGDGDGNARDADASDPGDWVTAGQCGHGESASPSSWHGTQTAGLIGAATDNGIGMASVGRNVMILPVRVLGKCGGYSSDIIAAMRWAAGISSDPVVNPHPARVINMSLGSTGSCSQAYSEAFADVKAAGVTVVVAAGNENGFAVDSPANCPGAVAVAGLRHAGTKVGYSNVGPEVTIAAPAGNCVNASGACLYPLLTTTNAGTSTPTTDTYSDSYDYSIGTSFAAPLVAGTVALMLSADPTLTPDAVVARLKSTARPFPTSSSDTSVTQCHAPNGQEQDECFCTTSTCGAGMLDAAAAVQAAPPSAAISASTTAPTAGDTVTLSGGGSSANAGRSIAGYQWQITAGATLAAFSGATTGSSATLLTSGAGSVTVELTVTDSAGASGSTTLTLAVQAAPVAGGGTDTAVDSGGGGGAFSALWIALLALAAAALRATWRRPRTAPRSPAA